MGDYTAIVLTIDYDNDHQLYALELKNAIHGLEKVIGRAFVENLLDALEDSGVDFSDTKRYSLRQIKKKLVFLFGNEATELLMPRIRKNLV